MQATATIATRESLLSRLKNSEDHDSWRQFFDTYWKLIYSVALRAGLTENEAQEVVQDTVVAIAASIKDFRYSPEKASFKTWLNKITRFRIADQFRKRRPGKFVPYPADTSNSPHPIEELADPRSMDLDQQWENDWRENILQAGLERIRNQIPAKHFQTFDLHVTRKWPAAAVARAVGISVGQVYLIRFRVMKLLKAEVKRLENQVV